MTANKTLSSIDITTLSSVVGGEVPSEVRATPEWQKLRNCVHGAGNVAGLAVGGDKATAMCANQYLKDLYDHGKEAPGYFRLPGER
jgi:hypothetical protein